MGVIRQGKQRFSRNAKQSSASVLGLAAGALGWSGLAQASEGERSLQTLLLPDHYQILDDGKVVFALKTGETLSLTADQYLILEDGLLLITDDLAQASISSLPVMGSVRAGLLSELQPVRAIDGSVVKAEGNEPVWSGEGHAPRLSEQVAFERFELAQAQAEAPEEDGSNGDNDDVVAALPGLSGGAGVLAFFGLLIASEQPEGEQGQEQQEPEEQEEQQAIIRRLFDENFTEDPYGYVEVSGSVYFEGYTGTDTTWVYDGTSDPEIVSSGSSRFEFYWGGKKALVPVTQFEDSIYFAGSDTTVTDSDSELWKYDGTTATMVNGPDGINSSGDSYPSDLTVFNGALYFGADDGTNGRELWKYDGTTATLVNGSDGINLSGGSYPSDLTVFDGALYFEADDGTNGSELWKYDGTTATIVNGPNGINLSDGSYPSDLTVFDDALYFEADDGTNGSELWKYDGTTATIVNGPNGINPSDDSNPSSLTILDDALYFNADDGSNGYELWKYDGSTLELIDILSGAESSYPFSLSVAKGRLYFVAEVADKDGDGSIDETVLSYDPVNGLLDLLPAGVEPATGKNVNWAAIELAENVYFAAKDDAHGSEIWVTDGTLAGTSVIDTIPGPDGLEPNDMTLTSHGIIFTSEQSTSPWIIELV